MKKHFLKTVGFCLVLAIVACGGETTETDARDTAMQTMPVDTAMYEAASADLSGTKADTALTGRCEFTRKDNG